MPPHNTYFHIYNTYLTLHIYMHAEGIRIQIYYSVIFVFPSFVWHRWHRTPTMTSGSLLVSRITCSAAGVSQAKVSIMQTCPPLSHILSFSLSLSLFFSLFCWHLLNMSNWFWMMHLLCYLGPFLACPVHMIYGTSVRVNSSYGGYQYWLILFFHYLCKQLQK